MQGMGTGHIQSQPLSSERRLGLNFPAEGELRSKSYKHPWADGVGRAGSEGCCYPQKWGSGSSRSGSPRAQGTPGYPCVGIIHGTPPALLGMAAMPGLGQLPIIPTPLLLLEPLPTPLFGCVPPGLADRDPRICTAGCGPHVTGKQGEPGPRALPEPPLPPTLQPQAGEPGREAGHREVHAGDIPNHRKLLLAILLQVDSAQDRVVKREDGEKLAKVCEVPEGV